ncbi:uncharacterized protein LOC141619220 [Silene latifolia]|uniref:uncharacterized protein LOC141619220 n=1 Tax=Silene latifolia TaxID=37657 RepID=UPI003D78766B
MARRCENFSNWIENCELIEVAFSGSAHTWARGNSVETRKSARLDRALRNANWGALFEDAMTRHLPAIQSDHCPILISPNDDNWPSEGVFPSGLEILSQKLQEWNAEVFGYIFKRKRILFARIGGCQRELSISKQRNLIKLEAKLRKELDEVLAQEEILWYQKSRLEFIKDGDRNTSYFHVSTLVCRWRNRIISLKSPNGEWQDDPIQIKKIVLDYFKNLYTDDGYDPNANDNLARNIFGEIYH